MLIALSPAKTLDYETAPQTRRATQPALLNRAAQLVDEARKLSPDEIGALMGISEDLANLNHQRFMDWSLPFTVDNARQSLLAFKGDVYLGLEADTMKAADLDFAQKHLRILSGLYGVLRPLDLMQPYRLEMGLKFDNHAGGNLYDFWDDEITTTLNKQLQTLNSRVLVNLASKEYFRAVKPSALDAEVITPTFKELRGGKYRVISFFAKKARGQMARYAIDRRLDDVDGLKKFRVDGYRYNRSESSAREWVFTRDKG
jgi:cytoplasmic iron level regulating protein YaaA (DUF328/UPF0246 family)